MNTARAKYWSGNPRIQGSPSKMMKISHPSNLPWWWCCTILYSYQYCIYPLPQPHSHPILSGTALAWWWSSAEIRILVDFSSIAGPVQRANRRFRPVPHSLPPSLPTGTGSRNFSFLYKPHFLCEISGTNFCYSIFIISLTHPAHITPPSSVSSHPPSFKLCQRLNYSYMAPATSIPPVLWPPVYGVHYGTACDRLLQVTTYRQGGGW